MEYTVAMLDIVLMSLHQYQSVSASCWTNCNFSSSQQAVPYDDTIKRCPSCKVPIERDAGCAQMLCKRCKHVFCWYCLTSLDVSTGRKLRACTVCIVWVEIARDKSSVMIVVKSNTVQYCNHYSKILEMVKIIY